MSEQVARVGVDQVGGGVITGPGASSVTVNDKVISIINDSVSSHGESPHTRPTITKGAPTIFAEDKNISLTTVSIATCSHPVSTGSSNTYGL